MTFLWIIPLAVAIDQASKFIVRGSMTLHQSEPVLGDFFRLTYIHNPGAAFGLNVGSRFCTPPSRSSRSASSFTSIARSPKTSGSCA